MNAGPIYRRYNRITDALQAPVLVVASAYPTFADAIAGVIQHLVRAGGLSPTLAADAMQRIQEREAMASTAMVDIGVSIPHARLEGVSGVIAGMAVSAQAVYHAGDGLPISIVVLVLSSPHLTGEHLNVLSSVSLILQSGRTRDLIRRAQSADEVLRLISSNDRG